MIFLFVQNSPAITTNYHRSVLGDFKRKTHSLVNTSRTDNRCIWACAQVSPCRNRSLEKRGRVNSTNRSLVYFYLLRATLWICEPQIRTLLYMYIKTRINVYVAARPHACLMTIEEAVSTICLRVLFPNTRACTNCCLLFAPNVREQFTLKEGRRHIKSNAIRTTSLHAWICTRPCTFVFFSIISHGSCVFTSKVTLVSARGPTGQLKVTLLPPAERVRFFTASSLPRQPRSRLQRQQHHPQRRRRPHVLSGPAEASRASRSEFSSSPCDEQKIDLPWNICTWGSES